MILLRFFLNPSFRPCLYDAQVVPLLSMRKLFFLLGFCAALPLTAQVKSERIALDLVFSAPTEQNEPLKCSGNHAFPDNAFPSWSIVLSGEQALSIPSVSFSSFDTLRLPQGSTLAQPFDLHAQQVQFLPFTLRGRRYLRVVGPALFIDNQNHLLIPRELELKPQSPSGPTPPAILTTLATNSALSQGAWFKMGMLTEGVHRLDYEQLIQWQVISAPVPSAQFGMLGNGGYRLPEDLNQPRPTDLNPIPIFMVDGGDAQFGPGDYLLFYTHGLNQWLWNGLEYVHNNNMYSDTVYAFLSPNQPGPRLAMTPMPSGSPTYVSTKGDFFQWVEDEKQNLIKSGRKWFGDVFSFTNAYSYPFSLGAFTPGDSVAFRVATAARCVGCSSNFSFSANGSPAGSTTLGQVSSNYAGNYITENTFSSKIQVNSANLTIQVTRTSPQSGSEDQRAWLDFVSIHYRPTLQFNGQPFVFQDYLAQGLAEYRILNTSQSMQVWRVDDMANVQVLSPAVGSGFNYLRVPNSEGGKYAVFGAPASLPTPFYFGQVPNQDLHALVLSEPLPDLLVITHPSLVEPAQELADMHQIQDGMTVHLLTTQQIFNEYSSGAQDITAIRDFVRSYFQARGDSIGPRYLMIYGSGSFDYLPHRNRLAAPNHNLVPSFQTWDSRSRSGGSHPSDFFYAAFSPNTSSDGVVNSSTPIWLGIGRVLATTPAEGFAYNRKVMHYQESNQCLGEWRNTVTLFSDDMEAAWESSFVTDNEWIYNWLKNNKPVWNVDKVYIDAFQQNTTAGQRYPDANDYLNRRINKGSLFLNYIGHGGESGLTAERVLQIDDIEQWNNSNQFSIFSTATCTFTRFDDPTFESAGVRVLQREDKGAVALLSTVRAIPVVPTYLKKWTRATFDALDADNTRLGDILFESRKCIPSCDGGENNILLFGDPALRPAFPRYLVLTDTLNGQALNLQTFSDTLKATDIVRISGRVASRDSLTLESFNGIVSVSVFDKPRQLQTLKNDPDGMNFDFELQNSVVFRGQASVINGRWSIQFKVPLDINYLVGEGKFSYYAHNGNVDAHGYEAKIKVGGASGNCQDDDQGPEINLFMNDSLFVDLGITNKAPTFYAELFDQSGINTANGGIGHEIQLSLSGPINQTFYLNDYYQAAINSYQAGSLRFQLKDLPLGFYSAELLVWDACNRASRKSLNFTVVGNQPNAIRIEAWPNPFDLSTALTFQHNLAGREVQVNARIADLRGSLVRELNWSGNPGGFQGVNLSWDGKNSSGSNVSPGVYILSVDVIDEFNQTTSGYARVIYAGQP